MQWITVPNVERETWRRIVEMSNLELALDEIAKHHGPARTASDKSYYKKQALQLRACILQAREYFAAAAGSLVTGPTHLYYGMASLMSGVMLLRGDGTRSLDYLRKSSANRSHGLHFTTGVDAEATKRGLRLLSDTHVEVLANGHFVNWVSTLPDTEFVYGMHTTAYADGSSRSSFEPCGYQRLTAAVQLVGAKRNLLEICQFLPDLTLDLARYRVLVAQSRCTYEMRTDVSSKTRSFAWRMHGAGSIEQMDKIVNCFSMQAGHEHLLSREPREPSAFCTVRIKGSPPHTGVPFSFPSMRETLDLQQVIYANDLVTSELVDAYLLGFGLSMLARYYPDYWVGCLESHCHAAQLIERVLSVLIHKFPILALSLLASDRIVVSLHRAPWHD